jgi:hypothetical protein
LSWRFVDLQAEFSFLPESEVTAAADRTGGISFDRYPTARAEPFIRRAFNRMVSSPSAA